MEDFLRSTKAEVEDDHEVEAWFSRVYDVAYNVEDVLDESPPLFGCCNGDHRFNGQIFKDQHIWYDNRGDVPLVGDMFGIERPKEAHDPNIWDGRARETTYIPSGT